VNLTKNTAGLLLRHFISNLFSEGAAMSKDKKPKDIEPNHVVVIPEVIVAKDVPFVTVTKPSGEEITTEFLPTITNTEIVTASTGYAGVTLTEPQFHEVVRQVDAAEEFAQSQEPEEEINTSHTLEIGIPGVIKYIWKWGKKTKK